MAFDDFAKQIFKDKFGGAVETEISVGTLEKSFDILLLGSLPAIQSSDLLPNLFKQYENNIIEYKSARDKYNVRQVLKLNGDFSYYSFNKGFSLNYAFNNSCLWFIVANREPFNRNYKKNGFLPESGEPGYYLLSNSNPPIRVIVLEELDITLKSNTMLLFLASGKKFGSFAGELNEDPDLISMLQRYINRKLFIENGEVSEMEEVKILKEKSSFLSEENIRRYFEEAGLEKVISAVGLETIISGIGVDNFVKVLGLDNFVKVLGLDNFIKSIPPDRLDEVSKLIDKRKKQ